MDLLDLIGGDTPLRKTASTHGGNGVVRAPSVEAGTVFKSSPSAEDGRVARAVLRLSGGFALRTATVDLPRGAGAGLVEGPWFDG